MPFLFCSAQTFHMCVSGSGGCCCFCVGGEVLIYKSVGNFIVRSERRKNYTDIRANFVEVSSKYEDTCWQQIVIKWLAVC